MTGIAPVTTEHRPLPGASAAEAAASAQRFAAALSSATAATTLGAPALPSPSPLSLSPSPAAGFVTLGEMATGELTGVGAAARGGLLTGAPSAVGSLGALDGSGSGNQVIETAKKYLGVPYKWGGTNPATGLDCSGFVQRVYADLGVSLPRVSVDQARAGTAVPSMDQAQPGDLVFWRGSPNHIGIYAGDGQMIVAPRTGDVVKFQKITRTPHEIRRVT